MIIIKPVPTPHRCLNGQWFSYHTACERLINEKEKNIGKNKNK